MKKPFLSEEQNDRLALLSFVVSLILLVGSFYYYMVKTQSWVILWSGTALFAVTFRLVYRSFAYFFSKIEDGDNDY